MGFHQYRDIPLAALVEALLARATPLGRAAAAPGPAHPRGLVADDAPIVPDDIARGVNTLFDRRGPMPIAADIGDCLFTAMEIAHTELTAPATTPAWATAFRPASAPSSPPAGAP